MKRREFNRGAIATGAILMVPIQSRAQSEPAFVFPTSAGDIQIYPIHHASFVMETPKGVIYVDPVGDAALYEGLPAPDLIAITHEHGDHFDPETLKAISTSDTKILTNPAVGDMIPDDIVANSKSTIANGETYEFNDLKIDAIPAYNLTDDRLNFHPQGRDNGYIFNFDDFRLYVSGDTEDTPEMRALEDIDLAFLCMNLPFTQTAEQAASAVDAFRPKVVIPYHYQGRDGGTQDPQHFAELVGDASQVEIYDWYKGD